jgi:hypothetical protein
LSEVAEQHYRRGIELQDAGRFVEACDSYRAAVARDPLHAKAHNNLGVLLQAQGDLPGAVASYESAHGANPTLQPAIQNLAVASILLGGQRCDAGDFQTAADCYARAIALERDMAQAHFNHALTILLLGDYETGLDEYEWRWRLPELEGLVPSFAEPAWTGGSLQGKTILLFSEQGLGDVIQSARYIPMVGKSAKQVLVRCPESLKTLLQRSFPGVTVCSDADRLPPFDVRCALMSLPRVFRTRPDSIPGAVPYLSFDPAIAPRWRRPPAARRLKVGLCWASESRSGPQKSVHLRDLEPLGRVEGVSLISLQTGSFAREVAASPGMDVAEPEELRDFSDTAALISNLDLVISVDTAVAHLAGALAKPVWMLTPFPPDWRWRIQGENSPWYPTMRLFRQSRPGEWQGVIASVCAALAQQAGSRG